MSSYEVGILVGSLRKNSYNRQIAKELVRLSPEALTFRFIELGDLPLYNPDLEGDGVPEAWTRLREEVAAVDALIFCTPEYNRCMSGAMKNAIDVGSRPPGKSVWRGKPATVVTATPGGLGGYAANHSIRTSMVTLGVPVMAQPEVYLGRVKELLDEDGKIAKEDTREFLRKVMTAFGEWVEKNA